jgi:hypothetical protein
MKHIRFLGLTLALCATPALSDQRPSAQLPWRDSDEIKFASRLLKVAYINIENGPLVVTPIKEEAWSSRWYITPSENGYYRIKNKWTGCFLHLEYGKLECGDMDSAWWSAQWKFSRRNEFFSISNRWTACFLTKDNDTLSCVKGGRGMSQEWKHENLSQPAKPPAQASSSP